MLYEMFKASDLCRDLTAGGATVKTKLNAAITKWHKRNAMNPHVSKAGEKHADKIRELGVKATELNRELTGSDVVATTDAELLRHDKTKQLTTDTLKTHRALEKKMIAIDVMIEEISYIIGSVWRNRRLVRR